MITGLEITAAVIALQQLTDFAFRVVKRCARASKDVARANKDMDDFGSTMTSMHRNLKAFTRLVEQMSEMKLRILGDPEWVQLVENAVEEIKHTQSSIRETSLKIKDFVRYCSGPSRTLETWTRLRWAFSDRKSVKQVIARLKPVKLDIHLVVSLVTLQNILNELQEQRMQCHCVAAECTHISQHIIAEIKSLEEQCTVYQAQRDEAIQRYKDLVHEQSTSTIHHFDNAERTSQRMGEAITQLMSQTSELTREYVPKKRRRSKRSRESGGSDGSRGVGSGSSTSQPGATDSSSQSSPVDNVLLNGITELPASQTQTTLSRSSQHEGVVPAADVNADTSQDSTSETSESAEDESETSSLEARVHQNDTEQANHIGASDSEQEYMFVIHDNGQMVSEQWRRPRRRRRRRSSSQGAESS